MEELSPTKGKIYDVLTVLLRNNTVEKITVSKISKLAGINRSTFYEYFEDVYDLKDQFEDYLVDITLKTINVEFSFDGTTIQFTETSHVDIEPGYYSFIEFLIASDNTRFRLKLIKTLSMLISEEFDLNFNNTVVQCACISVVAGLITYLSQWCRIHPNPNDAPDKKLLNKHLLHVATESFNTLIKLDRDIKAGIA